MRKLRIATRGSKLALWQASEIASMLACPVEIVIVQTQGDRDQTSPLSEIGGEGVFAKEVQLQVVRGEADLAVHSAKDLPAGAVEGLVIGGVPKREDSRDAIVGVKLQAIEPGGVVATSSARRKAQLLHLRPDLRVEELRGNIETRISKAKDGYAVMVAYAALLRLDLASRAAEVFSTEIFCPQVGQGALAVECRSDDEEALDALRGLTDSDAMATLSAERALLARLGAGCSLPVAGSAVMDEEYVSLTAMVGSLDGRLIIRTTKRHKDPLICGELAGADLMERGGSALLLQSAGYTVPNLPF